MLNSSKEHHSFTIAKLARFTSLLRVLKQKLPTAATAEQLRKLESAWASRLTAGDARRRGDGMSSPENKSYLGAGMTALSPWASRSATPKSGVSAQESEDDKRKENPSAQRGGDYSVSRRLKRSFKSYPSDCPPLNVQWYHAVDVSLRSGA